MNLPNVTLPAKEDKRERISDHYFSFSKSSLSEDSSGDDISSEKRIFQKNQKMIKRLLSDENEKKDDSYYLKMYDEDGRMEKIYLNNIFEDFLRTNDFKLRYFSEILNFFDETKSHARKTILKFEHKKKMYESSVKKINRIEGFWIILKIGNPYQFSFISNREGFISLSNRDKWIRVDSTKCFRDLFQFIHEEYPNIYKYKIFYNVISKKTKIKLFSLYAPHIPNFEIEFFQSFPTEEDTIENSEDLSTFCSSSCDFFKKKMSNY